MRVEIDLPNPENLLCDGMYGKATIALERDPKSLTLPASCVTEHSGRAGGIVFVVRDGIARRTAVRWEATMGLRWRSSPESAPMKRSWSPRERRWRTACAWSRPAEPRPTLAGEPCQPRWSTLPTLIDP